MTRIVFLLLVVLLLAYQIKSQHLRGRNFRDMPKEGILRGKVIDKHTKSPIEYANVVLFKRSDSSLVTGGITDKDGLFEFNEIPYGAFFLTVKFIGYNKTEISGLIIRPNNKMVDLGEIHLGVASEQIDEVQVLADRNYVEYKIDRKVVHVGKDLSSSGGSAVEALENIPSVEVDIDGNVSLRGSDDFTVLINGKPSILSGTDALQQIPVSSIQNIEIITNPSAKYDPDGIAGIINIVLKKNILDGFSGIVNASAGTKHKYSSDILLNYRTDKINIFGGFNFRDSHYEGTGKIDQETYLADSITHLDIRGNHDMTRKGHSVKMGSDFFISDKTTLSLSGRMGKYGFGIARKMKMHEYFESSIDNIYTYSDNSMDRNSDYYGVNLNLNHQFSGPNHKLTAMVYFSQSDGGDTENQFDYDTDSLWNIIEERPYKVRSGEDDNNTEIRLKIDYSMPTGQDGIFETGFQSRIDDEVENFLFEEYNPEIRAWENNEMFSSSIDFSREIHSMYATYSDELAGIGFQAGLRGEYTNRRLIHDLAEDDYVIDRLDIFPTLHISKKLPHKQQIMASYSRRINRPRSWYLDPFPSYINPYVIRQGNPDLKPEYTDSYEIGYNKRVGNSSFSIETYYRKTNNNITRIRQLRDDGGMIHTIDNLKRDHSIGVEFMANLIPGKKFMANAGFNVFYYEIEGDIVSEDVEKSSQNWRSNINLTYRFNPDLRIQFNGGYRGPSVSPQGRREGNMFTSAGIKADFFERKLSATLNIRDIFGTSKREYISKGEGFYSKKVRKRESQIVTLNISYRINNYKKKEKSEEEMEMNFDSGGDF